MKDFIINLYANKYFPIYLGVVIIVLLIAFFVVFFLGKKDQKKIEETQKLNLEKLKEAQGNSTVTNNEIKQPAENIISQSKSDVNTVATPVINHNVNSEPLIKPVVNQSIENNITEPAIQAPIVETPIQVQQQKVENLTSQVKSQTVETPIKPVAPQNTTIPPVKPEPIQVVETQAIVEKTPAVNPSVNVKPTVQPVNPVVDDDVYRVNKKEEETVNRLKELSSSLDKEMSTFNTKPLVNEQINEVKPVINEEKPKVMNVYSSVYVPSNNVPTPEKVETPVINNVEEDFDDTMEIELPKLKAEEPVLKDNSSDPLNLL